MGVHYVTLIDVHYVTFIDVHYVAFIGIDVMLIMLHSLTLMLYSLCYIHWH